MKDKVNLEGYPEESLIPGLEILGTCLGIPITAKDAALSTPELHLKNTIKNNPYLWLSESEMIVENRRVMDLIQALRP